MTFEQADSAMQDAATHAATDVGSALLREAQRAIGLIQEQWPVKTGFSKASWSASRITGAEGGRISNTADYASAVQGGLADVLVPASISSLDAGTLADIERTITPRFEG